MTPTVVFDTFGIVSMETGGLVPLAYLVAMVVMFFTALSYGKMVGVFPAAGSAYTYTRETMHPALGFVVGWAALLDYLLLPVVNALLIRIYMEALFPEAPGWIWVGNVALITGINLRSMTSTSMASPLVIFEIALIVAFIVLATIQLGNGMGQAPPFHSSPVQRDRSAAISPGHRSASPSLAGRHHHVHRGGQTRRLCRGPSSLPGNRWRPLPCGWFASPFPR
jgi:putrescine importer